MRGGGGGGSAPADSPAFRGLCFAVRPVEIGLGRWVIQQMRSKWGSQKNYFKDWCLMNSQPILFIFMVILSKGCKLDNFESHNSLKLRFTDIFLNVNLSFNQTLLTLPHHEYQVKLHPSPCFSAACAAKIVQRNYFFSFVPIEWTF